MAQRKKSTSGKLAELLKLKGKKAFSDSKNPLVHRHAHGIICTTDGLGFPTAGNRSPVEIVVDASEGFIPLWDEGMILRWKFDETSLSMFSRPELLKNYVRELFGEALLQWGESVPIKFSENPKGWDFKVRVEADDNCNPYGCTLARAFFPDNGRNDLLLFPKMFSQSRKEQVDTILHEFGHIFGLRHFFAKISETAWPAEVFGEHNKFSIMNYGDDGELTNADKNDLAMLYELVWNGELTEINGTDIALVTPHHYAME